MGMNVGDLFATFKLDPSSVTSAVAGLQTQFTGIGQALAGLGLSRMITQPIKAMAKDIFQIGSSFDATLSRVNSLMGQLYAGDPDAAQRQANTLEILRQRAIELGEATSKTAQDAADAMTTLAMAGLKADDIDGGQIAKVAGPIVKLAEIAGSNDLGQLASYIVDPLMALHHGDANKVAEDASRLVNIFASVATNTNTSVDQLGEAFMRAAPTVAQFGYEMEDVGLALGLFASNGLKGGSAGNTLNRIMTNMASNTKAAKKMAEKGIALFDEKGQARSLIDVMRNIRSVVQGKTQEEVDSFAKETAQDMAKAIKEETGEALTDQELVDLTKALGGTYGMKGLAAWATMSEDAFESLLSTIHEQMSQGDLASEMSAAMLDNTAGKLTLLQSKLMSTKIILNDLVDDGVKKVIDELDSLVLWFNKLDKNVLSGIINLAGYAASWGPITLGMVAVSKIVPKLGAILTAMLSPMGLVTAGLLGMTTAFLNNNNKMGDSLLVLSDKAVEYLDRIAAAAKGFGLANMAKNMKTFFESAAKAARKFMPKLTGTLAPIVTDMMYTLMHSMGSIADFVTDSVKGFFSGIGAELPRQIPALIYMLTNAFTSAFAHIPNLIMGAGQFLKGLIAGVQNIDWGLIAQAVTTTFVDTLRRAGNALRREIPQILNAIWAGLNNTANMLQTGEVTKKIAEYREQVRASFGGVLDNIKISFTGKVDSSWSEVGQEIHKLIAAGIANTGEITKQLVLGEDYTPDASWATVGEKIIDSICEAIETGLPEIAGFLGGLVLGDDYSPNDSFAEVGTKIFKKIESGIDTAFATVTTLTQKIYGKLGEIKIDGTQVQILIENAGKFVESLIENLLNFTGVNLSGIGTFIKNLVDAINTNATWDTLGDTFSGIAKSIVDGIKDNLGNVETAIDGVVGGGAAILQGLFQSINKGLTNAKDMGLAETAGQVVSTVLTSITEALSGKNGEQANELGTVGMENGMLIVESLLTAMKAGVDELNNKDFGGNAVTMVTEFGKGIISAFKLHLPDVMADVGGLLTSLGESLFGEKGLIPEVAKGAGDLASQLAQAISEGFKTNSAAGDKSIGNAVVSFVQGMISSIPNLVDDAGKVFNAGAEIASTLMSNIASAMNSFVEGTDTTELSGTIQTAVTSLVTSLSEGISKLSVGGTEFMSAGVKLMQTLLSSMADAMTGFKDNGLFAQYGEMVAGLINNLTDVFTNGEALSGIGEDSATFAVTFVSGWLESLTNAIKGVNDHGTPKAIIDAVVNMGKSVITAMWENAPMLMESVGNLFSELGRALFGGDQESGLVTEVADGAKELADGIVGAIQQGLSNLASDETSTSFMDTVQSLITGMVQSIGTVAETGAHIVGAGAELAGSILNSLTDALSSTLEAGKEDNTLRDTMSTVVDSLVSGMTSVIGTVTDSIPGIVNVGGQLIGAILDSITDSLSQENLGDIGTKLGEMVGQLTNKLVESITSLDLNVAGQNVSSIGMSLFEGIVNALTSFVNTMNNGKGFEGITDAFVQLGTGLIDGIKNNIPSLLSGIGDLFGALGTALFDSEGGLVKSVLEGATTLASSITAAVGEGLHSLTFSEEGETSPFADILTNLIQGMIDAVPAIGEAVGDTVSIVAQLGTKILTSLGNVFSDVKSSGIDFGKIATDLIKGILTGIPDLTNNADVQKFMKALGDGIRGACTELGNIVGTIVSYLLSAEGLNDMLNAGKALGQMAIDGLSMAFSGALVFMTNFLNELLIGWGLIDRATVENFDEMAEVADKSAQTVYDAFVEGLNNSEAPTDIDAEMDLDTIMAAWLVKGAQTAETYDNEVGVLEAVRDKFQTQTGDILSSMFDDIGEAWMTERRNGNNTGEALKQIFFNQLQSHFGNETAQEFAQQFNDEFSNAMFTALAESYTGNTTDRELLFSQYAMKLLGLDQPVDTTEIEAKAADKAKLIAKGMTDETAQTVNEQLAKEGVDVGATLELNPEIAIDENTTVEDAVKMIKEAAQKAKESAEKAVESDPDSTTVKQEVEVETQVKEADVATLVKEYEAAQKKVNALASQLSTLQTSISSAETSTSNISDETKKAFEEALSTANGNTIGDSFIKGIVEGMNGAVDGLTDLAKQIAEAFANAMKGVKTDGGESQGGGGENAATTTGGGDNAKVTGTSDSAIEALKTLAESAKTYGDQFTTNLQTSLTTGLNTVNTEVNTSSTTIKTTVETALSAANGSTIGSAFATGIGSGIYGQVSIVSQYARTLGMAARVAASVGLGSGNTIGAFFSQGVANGIMSGIDSVSAAGRAVGNAAKNAAGGAVEVGSPARAGIRIGAFFSEGMKLGLLSGINAVYQSGTDIGNAVDAGVRDTLQIHSPSVRAAKTMENYVLGASEGLTGTRSVSSLVNAAKQVANNVADTVKSEMAKYGKSDIPLPADGLTVNKNGQIELTLPETSKNMANDVSNPVVQAVKSVTKETEKVVTAITKQTQTSSSSTTAGKNNPAANTPSAPAAEKKAASTKAEASAPATDASLEQWKNEIKLAMQEYAMMFVDGLSGIKVEMDGEEVGIIVAPTVSEIISGGARARRYV